MKHLEFIDDQLLDEVSEQAKASPRLRMNYNFHKSLNEKCHRMLNALEPDTEIPIHRHPKKDETIIILTGKAKVFTYNSKGTMEDYALLCCDDVGNIDVNIPKNTWHTIKCVEPCVLFECKEGPYMPHEEEGILKLNNKK